MFKYFKSSKQDAVRLLVILCSDADVLLFKRAAAQRTNWNLAAAHNWDEAAPLLASGQFAVIVYDRDLPNRDWRQTVRNLTSFSPCVLLASKGIDASLWQEVVQCGGHDVLAKPVEERGVLKTIDQALRYTMAVKK